MIAGLIWRIVIIVALLPYMLRSMKNYTNLQAFRKWEQASLRRANKIAISRDSLIYRIYINNETRK
jgi:hypothetical protein